MPEAASDKLLTIPSSEHPELITPTTSGSMGAADGDRGCRRTNAKNPEGHSGLSRFSKGADDVTARQPASRVASFDDTFALATATRRFGDLLALLDRRLHVVAPLLQLAQQTLSRKLALEVFDCSLDPFAINDDLEGLALYGFARVRQGTGTFADIVMECKSRSRASGTVRRVF
jgi:hypothetical protein